MSWWARRRLRTRILLPFALLIVGVLLATLWVGSALVAAWVEASLRRQFDVTANVFGTLLAERASRLRSETSLLAADFALKRALATYDPDTLVSVAQNQRERLGVDLLWIADDHGRLLAAVGGGAAPGTDVATLPPLPRVMESGEAQVVVTATGGALVQLVATPVFAPDPIGFLIAGKAIDDATAQHLGTTTGTRISFLTHATVYASSLGADERGAALPLAAGKLAQRLGAATDPGRTTFLVRAAGMRMLSVLIAIPAELPHPLFALVQASYDDALGPLGALPQWVTGIGFAALVLALLVGGVIASGIAAPLASMAQAMGAVLGGDLSRRVTLARSDEVGFLARAFNEMVRGLAERERVKDLFGRFVSRDVADAVLRGDVALGGERRPVTILFQDVRGFTTIAERTSPDVLVRIVNRLFTEMVDAVESEGGIIRQFVGDGVMALFGAPVQHIDDPERAVRAALGMVARLPAVNADLALDGIPPLRIGIGIHTGEVVAGEIGPDRRSEYGVVGDAVNLASRIEGLTRDLGVTILVSADTARQLGAGFVLGQRHVVPVRGKAEPVEVVEVPAA
jgi:adenylate cyclase